MAIAFPALPKEAQVKQRLIGFGQRLTPMLGGPVQDVARLGDRYALDVTLPALELAGARGFIAAQLRAKTLGETLTLAWPQPAFITSIGAPVADGGSQAGSLLAIRGLTPNVEIPALTFFSFQANGRHYLHATTADATANGTGHVSLPISPMLRYPPTDAAALEFGAPTLEGLLADTNVEWDLTRLRTYGGAFSLGENE